MKTLQDFQFAYENANTNEQRLIILDKMKLSLSMLDINKFTVWQLSRSNKILERTNVLSGNIKK